MTNERTELLASITGTIKTYRMGELPEPTPDHIDRWANQFTQQNQLPFLREFNHVLRQTFLPRESVVQFLNNLVDNEKLAGKDPKTYWSTANLLSIQKAGQSQKEMVKLFAETLRTKYGLDITKCGADGGDYIYLDDVLFSGRRVGTDLEAWITEKAPKNATVHVIVIACHALGQYYTNTRLKKFAHSSNKSIRIDYWALITLENRRFRKNDSQVLWPAVVPNDAAVEAYIASEKRFPLDPRKPGGALSIFSSEEGRQVLESEFLMAGVKIRSMTQSPKDFVRPLGFGSFGAGFGSLIATYRNCPNNCPLALWWGDPTVNAGALHWYPLLQRKTYASPENILNEFEDLTI